MDLDKILEDIELDKTAEPSDEAASDEQNDVDTSPETIEKLASYLDAYSKKNTLIDDIARIAVIQDKVNLVKAAEYLKAQEAEKND